MYIYADNAATTKISKSALDAMIKTNEEAYGNPSSLHSVGQKAKEVLEQARVDIAKCIGADFKEIYFTSGGSEADNQAIISAAKLGALRNKKHIISTKIEHHAVLHTLNKLEKEGLFSKEHKKQLPVMPKVIGVLTSNTGSVIKDIINVSTRRNPNVYIRLYPVPVQGEGAGEKIAEAIKIMNKNKLADVLILARGGGSLEDLWPFNEEVVARAIYESELPIVSAVGHETDFSISDFVADLRAPTPSAAAEIVVPNISDIMQNLSTYNIRLKNALKKKVELMQMRYEKCMRSRVYTDPLKIVNDNYLKLDILVKSITNSVTNKLQVSKTQAIKNFSKLDALSPLKTLSRGYSIIEKNNGIVKSIADLQKDDTINIRMQDGKKQAKIL